MFGANITYAGLSVFGNVLFGAVNGTLGLKPQGAPDAVGFGAGVKYAIGRYTIGAVFSQYDSQGAYQLTGISQRHANVFDAAATYSLAPGMTVYTEYLYGTMHQGNYDFKTNTAGSSSNNNVHTQGVDFGINLAW